MKIQWDNGLNTGNQVVDSQHQELFKRVGLLIDACRQDMPGEAVWAMVNFTEQYMVEHFATEEKLIRQYDVPDAEAHFAEHREFCALVGRIKKLFAIRGADYSLAIDTISTIAGWVGSHIHGRDKALCRFIHEQEEISKQQPAIVHPLNLSD